MAGSSESLDKLAKASTQAKVALLGLALALLGVVYYNLMYTDLVAERNGLVSVKKRQIEDERRLIKRKADYQELLKQKADVEQRLRANAIKLPESSELPAFFQHLETQAATANVKIISRTTEKTVPIETYLKVPVRMEVVGDFYQLNDYFKLLYETARIITIENLFIGNRRLDGDHMVLTAKFEASTFRQADKPRRKGAKAAANQAREQSDEEAPPAPTPTPTPAPAPAEAPSENGSAASAPPAAPKPAALQPDEVK